MKLKMNFKEVLLFLIFVFLFLLPFLTQALEIDYPEILGLKIDENSTLPEYAAYLFRFLLFSSLSLAGIVIALGGIYYLISYARGSFTNEAKEWIKNGVLGLLIILSTYLIAYTINPNLVIFEGSELPFLRSEEEKSSSKESEGNIEYYQEIPVGILIEKLLTRKIDCYDFDYKGDPIEGENVTLLNRQTRKGPTFLEHDRADCVLKLSQAIERKSKIINKLAEKIAKVMEECECTEDACIPCKSCELKGKCPEGYCEGDCKEEGMKCKKREGKEPCPEAIKQTIESGSFKMIFEKGEIKEVVSSQEAQTQQRRSEKDKEENCIFEKEYQGLNEFRSRYSIISPLVEMKIQIKAGDNPEDIRTITLIDISKWQQLRLVEQLMYLQEKFGEIKRGIEVDISNLKRAKSKTSECYLAKSSVDFMRIKEQTKKEKIITVQQLFVDPYENKPIKVSTYCKGFKYKKDFCYQLCDNACPGNTWDDINCYKKCPGCYDINPHKNPDEYQECLERQSACMKECYDNRRCKYKINNQRPENFLTCLNACNINDFTDCCIKYTGCPQEKCNELAQSFNNSLFNECFKGFEDCKKKCADFSKTFAGKVTETTISILRWLTALTPQEIKEKVKSILSCEALICKNGLKKCKEEFLDDFSSKVGTNSEEFKKCVEEKIENFPSLLYEKQECCYIDFKKLRDCAESTFDLYGFEYCQKTAAYRCKFASDQTAENYSYPSPCPFCADTPSWLTVYGHLDKITVNEGDIVNKGDVIGEVGRIGTNMVPHLHFAVGIESTSWQSIYDAAISIDIYDVIKLNRSVGSSCPAKENVLPANCVDADYLYFIKSTLVPPLEKSHCTWEELYGSCLHANNAYWAQDWACQEGPKITEKAKVRVMSGGTNVESKVIKILKEEGGVVIRHRLINSSSTGEKEKYNLKLVAPDCREESFNDDPLTFYCLESWVKKEEAAAVSTQEEPLGVFRRFSPADEIPVGETTDKAIKWGEDFINAINLLWKKTNSMVEYIKKIGNERNYCQCDSDCGDGEAACNAKCEFKLTLIPVFDPRTSSIKFIPICSCEFESCLGKNPCLKMIHLLKGKDAKKKNTEEDRCPKNCTWKKGYPEVKGIEEVCSGTEGVDWFWYQIKKGIENYQKFLEKGGWSDVLKLLSYSRKKMNECSIKARGYGKEVRILPCQRVMDEIIPPIEKNKLKIDDKIFKGYCYGKKINLFFKNEGKTFMDNWFCVEEWEKGKIETGVEKMAK